MTESQTTCVSGKKTPEPKHGKLQKFYDLLHGKEYGDLAAGLRSYSCCAVGTKLGLEDMSAEGADKVVREYDKGLYWAGRDIYVAALVLRSGDSQPQRNIMYIEEKLGRIAEHRVDREKLDRAIREVTA